MTRLYAGCISDDGVLPEWYAEAYLANGLNGGLDPPDAREGKPAKLTIGADGEPYWPAMIRCFLTQLTRKDCGHPIFRAPLAELDPWSRALAPPLTDATLAAACHALVPDDAMRRAA